MTDIGAELCIQEHVRELDVAMGKLGYDIALDFINDFESETVKLSEKLTPPEMARAMYHIAYVVGFADGRDLTVAELFDELGVP
jgi:hypothetical protein